MNSSINNKLKYISLVFAWLSLILFAISCINLYIDPTNIRLETNNNFFTIIGASAIILFITWAICRQFKIKFWILYSAVFIVDAINLIILINPIIDIIWLASLCCFVCVLLPNLTSK